MVRMQGLKGNEKSNYFYFFALNSLAGVHFPALGSKHMALSLLAHSLHHALS